MNIKEFNDWFRDPIIEMQKNEKCGFFLMFVSFPLIERYLREISGLCEKPNLNDHFFEEFLKIFPELASTEIAKEFWGIFRHGLLHQATMRCSGKKSALSRSIDMIKFDSDTYLVNPIDFFTEGSLYNRKQLRYLS